MTKQNLGIDIIIPVYNALEDLKLCMESIKKHTDLQVNRVVLIDDQSPDPKVYPYLQSQEQPGIVVMQNEQNQGFSGTINRGLQYSDRDVVLLNTDTVVTAGWIEKLTACAYSDKAIGTVTPFSNNATLCSIPNFCQENTIPYGLSIDEYAAIIERCSLKKYPRITVAVGFCMFIKREVIDRVGLFDQETFKKGYGEENDFCWRTEQLGYQHVLCDDTYIYHSGTASFVSDEKKKLAAEHEEIIEQRYPVQNQRNREYVRDNPHQYLRTNVDIYAKLANGKKNILYVLHADFRTDVFNSIGGTQFHVKDLVTYMRKENNVFVLARDREVLRLTVYLEQEQMTFAFHIGKAPDFQPFYSKPIETVLRQIFAAFSIDMVHVHHVFGLSFDVFSVAKELGISLALTMHDYYFVCPTLKLLENGRVYCGGEGKDCAGCMCKELGYARQTNYLPTWREECLRAMSACDTLIVPSQSVKTLYSQVYPTLADRISVIPHGMDAFTTENSGFRKEPSTGLTYCVESAFDGNYSISGWAFQEGVDSRYSEVFVYLQDQDGNGCEYRALSISRQDVANQNGNEKYTYSGFRVQVPDGFFTSGPLKLQLIIKNNGDEYCSEITTLNGYVKRKKERRRVAFLGGLNETKGSKLACQMIKQSGNQYDWYIIGGIGDPELLTLEKHNVFKTDWYKRENVGAILQQNRIDLVCILSICPESFSYTLSETQLAGIPVLAMDMGALGERISRDQTGWLVSPTAQAKEILKKLEDIFSDETAFRQMQEKVAAFRHTTIAQMCEEYTRLYSMFPSSRKSAVGFDAQAIYNAYVLCQMEQTGYGSTSDLELIRRVNELETTLNEIHCSLEYKMLRYFNGERFPFKRQFRWLVRFAYKVYVKFFR